MVTAVSSPRCGGKLKCGGLTTRASHGGGIVWGVGRGSPLHHLGRLVRDWAKDAQTLSGCLVSSQTTAVTSTVKTAWAGTEQNPHRRAPSISAVSNQPGCANHGAVPKLQPSLPRVCRCAEGIQTPVRAAPPSPGQLLLLRDLRGVSMN